MIFQALPGDFTGLEVARPISVLDLTTHLTPALSPNFVGGEGGFSAFVPQNLRLDWSGSHPQNSNFTTACPLLEERKQVRASVSTNFFFH